MGDTYDSAADAEADREQQRQLLAALNAWDRALRRDECGAWTIQGTRGTIHTYGDGKSWIMYVACRSDRHWSWVKKTLAFCRVALDCDGEGTLRLRQLPTAAEAAVIREELGIRKKQTVSEQTLERLKAFSFEKKPRDEVTNAPNIGLGDRPPPSDAYPDQTPILNAELAK
jgi:hypothetical protein